MVFSDFSEDGFSGFTSIIFVVEQEDGWVSLLENSGNSSFVEWHNNWERVFVDEVFQVVGVESSIEVVLSFIELFV